MTVGGTKAGARLRRALMFVASLVLVASAWELYKLVGPEHGGRVLGARILPRTENSSMPHVWDMLARFRRPEVRGSSRTVGAAVAAGAWYTMRLALAGFALGCVIGLVLAIVMVRFRLAAAALLPYVVLSQTVPLIALAPQVVSWSQHLTLLGAKWQPWMSVSTIAAYLAFFPVAVGALRGLQSPDENAVELMDSYAASWRQTLWKVRFPAAISHLIPALKLAGVASVVGAIVAEISTGRRGGIGRLILEYSREATSDPAKVFTAVIAAAVIGLVMTGLVVAFDVSLSRHRPREAAL
ncbi:MAG: ABC transporter permease subunit [Acidimicrobiales bacterium]